MHSLNVLIYRRKEVFVILAYLFAFLTDISFGIFWTTWAAYLKLQGLPLSSMCLALALMFGTIGLLEIPTGVIADRFGRKKSSICGLFLVAFGFLIVFLSNDFAVHIGVFVGLGTTLISGAKNAWLLDIFPDKSDLGKKRFLNLLDIMGRVAFIFGAYITVAVFSENQEIIWLCGFISAFLALMIASLTKRGSADLDLKASSLIRISILKEVKQFPLIMLLVSTVFFGLENGLRNTIVPIGLLNISNDNIFSLGYLMIVTNVMGLLGALFYRNALYRLNSRYLVAFSLTCYGTIEAFMPMVTSSWLYVGALGVGVFTFGWYYSLRGFGINVLVKNKSVLASILSIDSMVQNMASATVLFALYAFGNTNLHLLWYCSSFFLIMGAIAFLFTKDSKGESGEVVDRHSNDEAVVFQLQSPALKKNLESSVLMQTLVRRRTASSKFSYSNKLRVR